MPHIKIDTCNNLVLVDGIKLEGVRQIDFNQQAGSDPTIKIELLACDMELNSSVIPELPEVLSPYYERRSKKRKDLKGVPRMRTVDECYIFIKNTDPESRVSKKYIRSLMNSGDIPSIPYGSHGRLINLDALLNYLANGNPISSSLETDSCMEVKVQRIRESNKPNYGQVRIVT